MAEVAKIMGREGDLRCFWLPNQRVTELLMCAYMDKLKEPILFHYDILNQLQKGKRLKQIKHITFTPSPAQMQFTDGETSRITRTSRPYLADRLPKEKITWIPKNSCEIKNQEKNNNYQLICSGVQLGVAELDSLSENNKYKQTLSGKGS